ncbi:hypothetical protein GF406_07400 [candidate division KSB1 bacterium]|nr:hypothetical protein [candidate division KSB1 bacterium]
MNTLLSVLQIALALKFISITYTHAIRPDRTKMQNEGLTFGRFTAPLLVLTGIFAFLGGIGLVLPFFMTHLKGFVTWIAVVLAVLILLGMMFHAFCRKRRLIIVDVILFVLIALLAWGRYAEIASFL